MIRITEHSFEQEPGLVELFRDSLPRARQRLHKPEGAHVECALFAGKSVNTGLRRVTINQAIADETAISWALEDRIHGAEHTRIVWGHEKYQRHDQERGIRFLAAIDLGEGAALLVPAAAHPFFIDAVPLLEPLGAVGRQRTFVRQADATIQRNPVHDL